MKNERKTIYLVEDPLLAKLMRAYLLAIFKGEIQIENYSRFETALEQFEHKRPRPNVVYGAMLHAQGIPLCAHIKSVEPSVRFILATGSLPETVNDLLLQEHHLPDAVLHKPFSLEQVQLVIRHLLLGHPLLPLGMVKAGTWPFHPLQGVWRSRGTLPRPVAPALSRNLPRPAGPA